MVVMGWDVRSRVFGEAVGERGKGGVVVWGWGGGRLLSFCYEVLRTMA